MICGTDPAHWSPVARVIASQIRSISSARRITACDSKESSKSICKEIALQRPKPANSIYNSAMTARFLRAAAQRLEPRPRLRAAVQLASFWQFCSRYEKLIFIYTYACDTYACDSMPLLAEQSFRTARCLRKTAIRSYLSILESVGSDLR
jgi:hypothetical protein